MHQKFMIFQDTDKNTFTIREYAVVNKKPKKMVSTMLHEEDFSLMAKETYDGATISKSISKGVEALVTTLRTANLFPIKPYAIKIAESVMAMYGSSEDNSVELVFDDQGA
jgi:hypothetical protein